MRMLVQMESRKSFQQWLVEQPIERQREIRAAERAFLQERKKDLGLSGAGGFTADPIQQAFEESMCGYGEPVAGSALAVDPPEWRYRRATGLHEPDA